jgi:hypothetical protein
VVLLQGGGGLYHVCQLGGCDIIVAGVVIMNKALKVGVEATKESKDATGLCVGLTALLTLLCQGVDPAGEG